MNAICTHFRARKEKNPQFKNTGLVQLKKIFAVMKSRINHVILFSQAGEKEIESPGRKSAMYQHIGAHVCTHGAPKANRDGWKGKD